MSAVVVDASAIVEVLTGSDPSDKITRTLKRKDVDLQIPALCDVEVVAGLRRGLAQGLLDARRADNALADYIDLPLSRHGHQRLLPRVLRLRQNFTAYDACYVALAEELGAAFVTADAPLRRAIEKHTRVRVLS